MENTGEKVVKKKPLIYIEVMRIVAIFFVIFNHTNEKGFFLFSTCPKGSIQFWLYMIISVFCKVSVPLFFAISGALMLHRKDEKLSDLFVKKILKMAVILLVFSAIYHLYALHMSGQLFDLEKFVITIYKSQTRTHLWYLYAYIAFLASLPFLRAMVKGLDTKYFYYLIGIALFFDGIRLIMEFVVWRGWYSINNNIKLTWLTANIVLYPCIGYFMEHRINIDNIKKKTLPLLWMANIVTIIISCYMTYYKGELQGVINEASSQGFLTIFVLVNCITLYMTTKYIFSKVTMPKILEKIVLSLGKSTFGIYLLHLLVKDKAINMIDIMTKAGCNHMIAVLVWCFMVMMVCWVITIVLRKIPVIKKLVGE